MTESNNRLLHTSYKSITHICNTLSQFLAFFPIVGTFFDLELNITQCTYYSSLRIHYGWVTKQEKGDRHILCEYIYIFTLICTYNAESYFELSDVKFVTLNLRFLNETSRRYCYTRQAVYI